jgi:hypothetical protein
MLSLKTDTVRMCAGVNRREWMRVGGLGAVGLMLPDLLRREAVAETTGKSFGRAKSCILCFMFGGQPHQDLYDLKPNAPVGVRGEFEPIQSSVPGTYLGELIPQTAKLAHCFSLIRSVTHPDSTHTIAMHSMMTGHRHRRPATNPMNAPDDFPCFGAVIQKLRPSQGVLPSGISLNAPGNEIPLGHIFPGYFAGFLGSNYDPLFVTDDPAKPGFKPVQTMTSEAPHRAASRQHLLDELDEFRRDFDFVDSIRSADLFQRRAMSLLSSPEASRAFALEQEPASTRERYGNSSFGQGCLLARRLIEAGVRLVTVNWARDYQPKIADHWDTHADHFRLTRDRLSPAFDAGLSGLLEDLQQRGLLDETLVVVMGEFGRTPQINKNAGRDHWPGCNSVLLAGGGIRGGLVHGASDSLAAYPSRDPVGPEDLAATIYHALGIPIHTEVIDHAGRPMFLSTGKPLLPLMIG